MKFKRFMTGFTMTLLAVVAVVNAQDETIRVDTNLVTVNVAITDRQGKSVKGLKQEQFEIFDNKTKQQISHFSAENTPVSFGLVYDMHPTTEDRTRAVLESLRTFTKELGPDDRFFFVGFNERGYLKADFIPTADQLRGNLKLDEPRSLYDAIYLAADKLSESRNLKRAIVVISDSADHHSQHSFSELSRKLRSFDVQVYAVIFDEKWGYSNLNWEGVRRTGISGDASRLDQAALQELTLKSGGTTNFPLSESGLELYRIYSRISEETREFYTLSFYPTGTPDGKWHNLRINLRSAQGRKRFALTYRPGYQSLKPKP